MLLQRKSLLGAIMGKRESKETPNISKMREILSKNRSSTADFKSTLEYFKSFKLVEQICERNLNSFRQFVDQLSYECFDPDSVVYDTRGSRDGKTWFIASGEVSIVNTTDGCEIGNMSDFITLGEFSAFGYEGCGEQELWQHYTARAASTCFLFCIASSKIAKFLASDNISQETFKRNFICSSLNILNEGSFCKSLIKKFVLKQFPKSAVLFEEGSKLDNFMLIRKGSVELFKIIEDKRGKNRVKIGFIGEGSFICEGRSLRQPEAICECTAEAVTNLEVYSIPRADLAKYFTQITDLETQLNIITEQKWLGRDRLIGNYFNNQTQQIQQCHPQMISPLFKKSTSGFRKKRQNTVNNQFVGPAKYDQMVANEEKVLIPLSAVKIKHRHRPKTKMRIQEMNKMLKEEKINKIMVKQLIHKRVRGIHDSQIKIQLKPTIFTEKLSGQFDNEMFKQIQGFSQINQNSNQQNGRGFYTPPSESLIQDRFESERNFQQKSTFSESYCPLGSADTGLINELSKSVLDYKKNVHCLRPRPEKKQKIGRRSNCDFSRIVREKMKGRSYFEYVKAPREKFQCDLNQVGDAYVMTQSRTGRTVRKRIRVK